MSIKHIIRCDGPTCAKEEALLTIQARHPGATPEYRRPKQWLQFDGYDFCSYFCASAYADDREHHPEKYHRHADTTLTGTIASLPVRLPQD